jgi:hypothetical protein
MTAPQAYPLGWPPGFPRSARREKGKFSTTLAGALDKVQTSLRLFAKDSGKTISGVVISSNYSLGNERPADPGVAVYFVWDGLGVAIPVDRYDTIAANLTAVHHIIEARRTELRHGTLALVRATFTGFAALPPPEPVDWRAILGLDLNAGPIAGAGALAAAELAFRTKAKTMHPDTPGGSHEAMANLNRAIAQARAELGDGR